MLKVPRHAEDVAETLARSLGLTRTAAQVLLSRGLGNPASAASYLEPRLASLTPPERMVDRAVAVSRIARAVREKERTVVFGDYDADGITATALLTDVLRVLDGDVTPILANRFEGGYGLSDPALDRVLVARPTLLITCDCGSSDHDRLERARRAGLEVVVIDHHRVPDSPLPALAFLNPHRPDCGFAYKGLASVGLALSVAAGVRADLGVALDMRQWLDFVALGTVADVAPLDGDNRSLVRAGLSVLARGTRPGIRALCEVAGCTVATPTGEDISFRLAPRINAPGRIDRAELALRLLLATRDDEARRLAVEVDACSTRRKEIERGVLDDALADLSSAPLESLSAIVVARQGWHPGVVGIVAGRLATMSGKPAVVVALDGASGRGSARAPQGYSVHEALVGCRDLLVGFGGHHAAAGLEVRSDRVEELRARFCQAIATQGSVATTPGFDAETFLFAGDSPMRVLRDLERFEPCGSANPSPRVAVERARVVDAQAVRGGHMRLRLDIAGRLMACFGPNMASRVDALRAAGSADVVGAFVRNTWQGGDGAEMRLVAAEPA
ncbi:MAG: single-stranded-DNA-specific exonuclease RecJ [Polyangiaceae bacterium]|jgi:single-stranded-DNA-specific exonuclease